jgi:hypothetical protein
MTLAKKRRARAAIITTTIPVIAVTITTKTLARAAIITPSNTRC